jgi:hypothetical protein
MRSSLAVSAALLCSAPLCAQVSFGTGCPGFSAQTPGLSFAGFPGSGLPWTFELSGKPSSSSVLLVGASTQQSAFGALPLDLGGLLPALAGCTLLVSADLLLPLTLDGSGKA